MTKSLLLKGLAGVAAVGGVATGGAVAFSNKDWFGIGDNRAANLRGDGKDGELGKFSHKDLIDKVGLSCQLTAKELRESDDKECKVKDNGTISIKVEGQIEDGITFTDTSKLRVRRSKEGVKKEKIIAED